MADDDSEQEERQHAEEVQYQEDQAEHEPDPSL
jgi:hypothetical protein